MPFALATASAPARTARAMGLPALLVKTPMVSASAGGPTNDNPPAIAAAANQVPGHFIAALPELCVVSRANFAARSSWSGTAKSARELREVDIFGQCVLRDEPARPDGLYGVFGRQNQPDMNL